jgi:hypothetical protein
MHWKRDPVRGYSVGYADSSALGSVIVLYECNGGCVMFLIGRGTAESDALEAWREAARLVSTRWALFVEAEAPARQWAFASYVAALDAEEAAAAELARFSFAVAA